MAVGCNKLEWPDVMELNVYVTEKVNLADKNEKVKYTGGRCITTCATQQHKEVEQYYRAMVSV